MKKIIVTNLTSPERIDKYLKSIFTEYSREYIKFLCKSGYIKLNNTPVNPAKKISSGTVIEVSFPERKDFFFKTQTELDIIYEDEQLLVINKPAGLVVHPARKFDTRITLLDILLEKYKPSLESWPLNRPFLVHRLDKDTSGVLLIAKTPQMQYWLSKQFQERNVKKCYRTIVSGKPQTLKGEILAPLRKIKTKTEVNILGKEAITRYKVISSTEDVSYVEVYPLTGRTHQVRTHLSFIKCPILGDVDYGGKKNVAGLQITRIMLHAYSINFLYLQGDKHKWIKFTAKLPQDFCQVLSYFQLSSR